MAWAGGRASPDLRIFAGRPPAGGPNTHARSEHPMSAPIPYGRFRAIAPKARALGPAGRKIGDGRPAPPGERKPPGAPPETLSYAKVAQCFARVREGSTAGTRVPSPPGAASAGDRGGSLPSGRLDASLLRRAPADGRYMRFACSTPGRETPKNLRKSQKMATWHTRD